MNIKHWKEIPDNPFLDSGNCQMWLAWLDEEDPQPFESLLSNDEKLRAERFRSPREANRFRVARSILRTLLGSYLSYDPEALVFSYGTHGKPELAEALDMGISFNVSHSGGLAVFAIARGGQVGVDVEEFHEINDLEATASVFLSPDELSQFKEIPGGRKLDRFFDLWTSKEAILKAYGTGFPKPSKDIFTNLLEPHPNDGGQNKNFESKHLTLFVPAVGFRGALALL